MQIEDGITEKGIFRQRIRKMFKTSLFPSGVEDDHKPFERQGKEVYVKVLDSQWGNFRNLL